MKIKNVIAYISFTFYCSNNCRAALYSMPKIPSLYICPVCSYVFIFFMFMALILFKIFLCCSCHRQLTFEGSHNDIQYRYYSIDVVTIFVELSERFFFFEYAFTFILEYSPKVFICYYLCICAQYFWLCGFSLFSWSEVSQQHNWDNISESLFVEYGRSEIGPFLHSPSEEHTSLHSTELILRNGCHNIADDGLAHSMRQLTAIRTVNVFFSCTMRTKYTIPVLNCGQQSETC